MRQGTRWSQEEGITEAIDLDEGDTEYENAE